MVSSAGTDPFDKAPSLINIVSMQCWCQNWWTIVIIVSWLRVVLLCVGGWQHWLCWRGSRGLILQSYICTVITDSELRRNHRPGSHILTPSHLPSSWGAAASPVCFTQNVNVMFSVLHFLVWPLPPNSPSYQAFVSKHGQIGCSLLGWPQSELSNFQNYPPKNGRKISGESV